MSIEPSGISEEMDCKEMERSVEAYLDGEFDSHDLAEADAHLAACARCRSMTETQSRVRALLRAKLRAAMGPGTPPGQAPEALRDRIGAALAHQRRPLWRRALTPVPLATLAACAAGAVVVLSIHTGPDPRIEEAILKHNRDLPLEMTAIGPGSEQAVAETFRPWLNFNLRPPRFQNPQVHFVGARRTYLRDQPAAYMRYDVPRGHLGLFVFTSSGSVVVSGRTVQLGPATVRIMNSRGYNVAIWQRNDIVYSLVSDLDEADLAQVVETVFDR